MLVIGGGIIGMLTARNLQKEGRSVALIDKGKLGGEATWAAGGILSTLNPWQQNTATQPLIDEGRQRFDTLAEELKQETEIDPEFIRSGVLVLDIDEKHQALEWAKNNNEILQVLTKPSLLEREKHISTKFDEALYHPSTAQIRPPRLISALQHSLMQKKVTLIQNTCIEKILVEGHVTKGVATKNGSIYSEKVILCSGAWTKNLLTENSSTNKSIDIQPVRGQMLLYKLPQQIISHIILKNKSYVIPRKDGHILCGSTVEHVGFENETTQAALQELQNIAHHLIPLLSEHKPIKQWSALRPGTQRDKPYICKHPEINGLYLNSGHYRYGILMSIASAGIMTKLVTNTLNTSQIAMYT